MLPKPLLRKGDASVFLASMVKVHGYEIQEALRGGSRRGLGRSFSANDVAKLQPSGQTHSKALKMLLLALSSAAVSRQGLSIRRGDAGRIEAATFMRHDGDDGPCKASVPVPANSSNDTLVLGGGVIGVSIAYHLALRNVTVTLIDRAGIASCASGKAGGFLARDWNDGSPVGALSRKSFDMHEEVAKTLGLKSYRRLKCQSVTVDGTGSKPSGAKLKNLEWTDLGIKGSRLLGDEATIAQVLPKELVDAMWTFAESKGSTFRKGVVEGLSYEDADGDKRLTGVVVDGELVPAGRIVLSTGPWGKLLQQALPTCPMYGVKYHSVLMRTGRVLNEAVFFSGMGDPEVYPRNDGDTYVTGFPDPATLVQENPGDVEVREDVCQHLIDTMKKVSSEMETAEVAKRQSCYLPFTRDSAPCMGLLPGHSNAYVATGHGCWGILNSLASGLAMSELILDGKASSLDLSPFSPNRFVY